MSRPPRFRARSRGFTLVEVATVVVIVGVLAVIGGVVFLRHRATTRLLEATSMTADIRNGQEAYKAEHGVYAVVSTSTGGFYPAQVPGKFATQWGGLCTVTCVEPKAWLRVSVVPSHPVVYGYATVAGIAGTDVLTMGDPDVPEPPVLPAGTPYYVTVARGDTNGDGIKSTVVSYSVSNQLFVQSE